MMSRNISKDDSYLVILGAGPQQVPAYLTASKLGIKTLAVDYNPDADARKYADRFLLANVKDKEECVCRLKELDFCYSGIMTYGVEISPVVSAVAKEFQLKGVSEETAFNTTNKCARSEILEKNGVPIPEFDILDSFRLPKFDFPFVIKPSDNSGSRGVRVVKSVEEWESAYAEALSYSSDRKVVAEELLFGEEISIEGFVSHGKMYVYGFTDRNYIRDGSFDPYFMEDGSSAPSDLAPEIIQAAKDVFSKGAKALGISEGPSKGDLIVTKDGVKILEITSRLSPAFSIFSPHVYGVDPLKNVILWAVGEDVSGSEFLPTLHKGVAHRYYYHRPGRVKSVKGLDTLKEQPGILSVIMLSRVNVGDILSEASYINRILYVIAVGEDRESAVRFAENALRTIQIETEPVEGDK